MDEDFSARRQDTNYATLESTVDHQRDRARPADMTRGAMTTATKDTPHGGEWPELPLGAWKDTYTTLHRWTQIVGKTRLALAPMQNHWWQVTLYVTARGLGTSPIPAGSRTFEVDFDFLDHALVVRTN